MISTGFSLSALFQAEGPLSYASVHMREQQFWNIPLNTF